MIDLEHVSKSYEEGDTVVFSDFSMHVEKGEFAVVTGKSGIGKSTLINMILLDEKPDAGKIYVNGRDIGRIPPKEIPFYRRKIGVIFQDFRLIGEQTVRENIAMAMLVTGAPANDSKIHHVAKLLGIVDLLKKYPREISGGQMQKVALARAIINDPLILIGDEPTANLDPGFSRSLRELFEIIHDQGTTLLVATHDPIIEGSRGCRIISLEPQVVGS